MWKLSMLSHDPDDWSNEKLPTFSPPSSQNAPPPIFPRFFNGRILPPPSAVSAGWWTTILVSWPSEGGGGSLKIWSWRVFCRLQCGKDAKTWSLFVCSRMEKLSLWINKIWRLLPSLELLLGGCSLNLLPIGGEWKLLCSKYLHLLFSIHLCSKLGLEFESIWFRLETLETIGLSLPLLLLYEFGSSWRACGVWRGGRGSPYSFLQQDY